MQRMRSGLGVWVGLLVLLIVVGLLVGQVSAQGPVPGTGSAAAKSDKQVPMTKDQAKELFKSVDEILGFVSSDTKLAIVHPVKRRLISRDEVTKYLEKKFAEDEGARKMEHAEIVLKKFGLLDKEFHLKPFLVTLLTEQIAGFYDNKTKTVNMLDWIQPEEQKPVLAHELTHALQDQKVDLTKWSDAGVNGLSKNVVEDNHHLQTDELETARSAVAEGQAMVTFIDYTLRPAGKTLADVPELMGQMKDSVSDSSGSPVLTRAPLLLQKSLLFPYSEGLSFEQALLVKGGKETAFAGALMNPPSSSFEIMTPTAYLAHTPVPVLRLPDIHPLLDAEYTPYDLGVMGELDVQILTELFGGEAVAEALAPAWNGGVYFAAQRKSAVTAAQKESTASIGLLYESRWKNRDSARTFARVYETQLARKYSHLERRIKDEVDETERVYSTEEGDVLLSTNSSSFFASEGFALPLARKLRDSIAAMQSDGPLQVAQSTGRSGASGHGELSLGLVRGLAGFGVMKAAVSPAIYSMGH